MHISRVKINNFRNFKHLDVHLAKQAVIVGENKSGKTNFVYALRLILDPDLPDSERHLKEEDFWDGLENPIENGEKIVISIEIQDFEENESLLAVLSDYIISNGEKPTARLTYKFYPSIIPKQKDEEEAKNEYDFIVFGGEEEISNFSYRDRKKLPLFLLPALRDVERDLDSWRKSPLRPLIDRLNITKHDLHSASEKVNDATEEILRLPEVKQLNEDVMFRLENMIGNFHSVSTTLGIAPTDSLRLLTCPPIIGP